MLVKQVALGAADTVLGTLVLLQGLMEQGDTGRAAGVLVTGGPVCTRSPWGWPQLGSLPV